MAPPRPKQLTQSGDEPLRLLVPKQLVVRAESETFVWVADRESLRARKRSVRLGAAGTEELIEVVEGLASTDKLIASGREGLADGTRINVLGEESPGNYSSRSATATPRTTAKVATDSIS